jgi:hypothetical protein
VAQEPENRMLFDLRGRRKRVIQVIYVILAVIMAASLVVIGLPGGINPFGNATTTIDGQSNVERADDLSERLATQPNNLNLAAEAIRARITAGNSLIDLDEETGAQNMTPEATEQYQLAAEDWNRYLKKSKGNPDPAVAQLMANTLFTLAQGSTVAQFEANIKDAARAQQIYAENAVKEQKNGGVNAAGPLATLATYQLYAQDYEAAEKTLARAKAATPDKDEREEIQELYDATEKDAKRIGKLVARAKKQAKKSGGESLESPLGSLGSQNSIQGTATP